MHIVCDVHERRSGIPDLLRVMSGVELEIEGLPAGDYQVSNDSLIERKTVVDLHGAVIKGHLWPQLAKLRGSVLFPYLLVEGIDLDRGPLHPNAIRGVCLGAIDSGIALIRTNHVRDSALWIHRLAVRAQREVVEVEMDALPVWPKAQAGVESAIGALCAMPGISVTTAVVLLSRFGSLSAVFSATSDELLLVPGIGPARAAAIRATLEQRFYEPAPESGDD